MEAMTAVGLTPLTVLSATRTKPRKLVSLHTTASLKNPTHTNLNTINAPTSLSKGLVLLSSVVTTGLANALTYEEALQLQESSSSSSSSAAAAAAVDSFISDINGVFDSVISFAVENPVVVFGGVAVFAVPLVLSRVLSNPNKAWGVETAKTAYAKLADDGGAQLLDIRAPVELRQVGSPDIRGLKKKPVTVVYKGDDKLGFLNKLSFKFKKPENTTLFILDKFDGNSELVAELVTANGFKAAYAIKDGAEGPRGWMNSGLPWVLPTKAFNLDFSGLTDAIDGAVGEGADAVSVALGIAAATGLGLLAFSEVETVLQFLGSAALIQVFSKKLLFAEDRKKTLKEVDEFLNTKIAPKELVDEIKEIGKALLPSPVTSRALPAPTDASSTAATESTVQKAESIPQANVPPKVEAVAEPAPEINSVPKAESPSENSRPLSPYANYPDLKPPSSPMPSQP